jgi:hypothetical protein
VERGERRVARRDGLAPESPEDVRAPLAEVGDPRARPSGCRLSRRTFTGGLEQLGRHAVGQQRDRGVAGDEAPVTVHHDRRVGLVPASTASMTSRTAPISGSSSPRRP